MLENALAAFYPAEPYLISVRNLYLTSSNVCSEGESPAFSLVCGGGTGDKAGKGCGRTLKMRHDNSRLVLFAATRADQATCWSPVMLSPGWRPKPLKIYFLRQI